MISNIIYNRNEVDERSESGEYLCDTIIVEDNTSPEDGTVPEYEQQSNSVVFKIPKKAKN